MHSRFISLQGSGETINHKQTPKRELEEFRYPFSPVRRRKTPQPPPKVEVDAKGTGSQGLSNFMRKKENTVGDLLKVTVNKVRKSKEASIGHSMNDHFMYEAGYDADYMFNNQPGIFMSGGNSSEDVLDFSNDLLEFSEISAGNDNVQLDNCNGGQNQRKRHLCWEYDINPSNSNAKDWYFEEHLVPLRTYSSNTFRGFCALTKLRKFYCDLQGFERVKELGASSNSQVLREAQLKLNKWKWLLDWFDLSNDRSKFQKYRIVKNVKVQKSMHRDRKTGLPRGKLDKIQKQKNKRVPTNQNKTLQVSQPNADGIKGLTTKTDGVDSIKIVGKSSGNHTHKGNIIKNGYSNVKETTAEKNKEKIRMKPRQQRKKMTKIRRKLWANIKKRYL